MPASLRRRLTAASALAVAITFAIASVAPAHARAAPNPHAASAIAAGQWLAGQLVDGGIPGFVGPDWGLTIDVLIALEATGADPAATAAVTDALATNVDAYATGGEFAPDLRIAGATAKLLYAAAVADRDPTGFGGHDLRERTLALVAGPDTGTQHGWMKNRDANGPADGGNMFDQSLAVLGLVRSGGVPQPVVDFLIGQQCPAGGFRLFPPADGAPCAAADPAAQTMDPDTTGMAVQALLAADAAGVPAAGAAADQGVAWLRSVQQPSGAFRGSAQTDFPNVNSTGLAGLALAAAGETTAADRAAGWVADQQLTAVDAGAAAAHAGAIGYTPDVLAEAVASGIPELGLDQWRRATAQAVLVLAGIPLGEVGITEPAPVPSPSPGPSSGPPASPGTPDGSGGGLPVTGVPVGVIAVAGMVALAVGTVLLGLSTRWRRSPSPESASRRTRYPAP
jgi:hypothetical protein